MKRVNAERWMRASRHACFTALVLAGCGGLATPGDDAKDGGRQGNQDAAASPADAAPPADASAAPLSAWSKDLGPGAALGTAVTAEGNVAVIAEIYGPLDPSVDPDGLPDGDMSCAEMSGFCYSDGVLAFFDAQGRTLWTKRWTAMPIRGLAVTSNGKIAVGLSQPTEGDGGPANVIATFDPTGAPSWNWNPTPEARIV